MKMMASVNVLERTILHQAGREIRTKTFISPEKQTSTTAVQRFDSTLKCSFDRVREEFVNKIKDVYGIAQVTSVTNRQPIFRGTICRVTVLL